MARTVTFDLAKQGSAEICAAFLALVVYPKDEKMREQLLCAEMNRQLREWARVDPEWATMCQSWPPKWLLFDPQRAERLHSQAMAVFNEKRIVAAEIARAFIVEAVAKKAGRPGIVLTEEGQLLGELSWENLGLWGLRQERRLAGRADDRDRVHWKTVQERSWVPAKPVLHLILAFTTMLHGEAASEERQASWAEAFSSPQNIRKLVQRAEVLRRSLPLKLGAKRRIREDEMIRLVAK